MSCLRNTLPELAAATSAALVVTVRGDYENIPDMEGLQTAFGYEQGKTEYLR